MEYKFPLPKTPFQNNEDEISHLRKLIAEKEKNLQEFGLKKETLTPTKEVLSEYKVTPASIALHPSYEIKKRRSRKNCLKNFSRRT